MQVKIEIAPEYTPARAVIYTDRLTPEIQRALDVLGAKNSPILGQHKERTLLLTPQDIYMARVENGEAVLYTQREKFSSRKRLYELREQLGEDFLQISKSCVVNISFIQSVEAGIGGGMLLKMKNGLSEYISRKYLQDFKTYLGL